MVVHLQLISAKLASALLLVVMAGVSATAQDYITRKYATSAERDVVYGTAPGFAGTTDTLRLNFYKPQGDGNQRRPLAIWVHGGGFTEGDRTSFNVLAEAYAQRGYASATISYRLGFYSAPGKTHPYAYDTAEVVRANYRAAQDLYGAIRYVMSRADADSIDPSFVVIGGASAGGMTCLQAAYINDDERYPATHGASDVAGVPFATRGELGPATGTLHTDILTPRILAVVNLFGAIQDTSFITSSDDPALYQYHQTGDPIVYCYAGRAFWTYPEVPNNYFMMHGSCDISQRLNHVGFPASRHKSWLYNGAVHGFHDPVSLDLDIAQFLSPLVTATLTGIDEESDGGGVGPENVAGRNIPAAYYHCVVADLNGRVFFDAELPAAHTFDLRETLPTLPNGVYVQKVGVETRLFVVLR